ncbi:hypothetical protein D3C77_338640 [compost metagenome]
MPGLGAAVTKQQPVTTIRIDPHRDQRGNGTDKAIDQYGNTGLGAAQIGTHQRGDFKATEAKQLLQRIIRQTLMERQGALDHLGLVANASGIQAGTRTAELDRRTTEQGTSQGTGCGGIADAHLAANEQLGAAGRRTQGTFTTTLQRLHALLPGHCRGLGKVRRARPHPQVTHTRQAQVRVDGAQVHHLQLRIELTRQHADRCATANKILQHLPGHRLGIGGNTFGDHPVITGEDRDAHLVQARFELPLQASELHRDPFQPPQRAGRLGQLLLTRQGLVAGSLVNGAAGIKPPVVTHGAVPFRVRGRPATVSTTRWQRSAIAWCSQPASST